MYSRILVPLDGSKLAEKALPHAEGLAKSSGATIHLINVLSRYTSASMLSGSFDSGPATVVGVDLARQLEEVQISESKQYLRHAADQLAHDGIKVQIEFHEGSARLYHRLRKAAWHRPYRHVHPRSWRIEAHVIGQYH